MKYRHPAAQPNANSASGPFVQFRPERQEQRFNVAPRDILRSWNGEDAGEGRPMLLVHSRTISQLISTWSSPRLQVHGRLDLSSRGTSSRVRPYTPIHARDR